VLQYVAQIVFNREKMEKTKNKLNTLASIFAVVIVVLGLITLIGIALFPNERYIGMGFPVTRLTPGYEGGGGGSGGEGGGGTTPSVPACERQYAYGGYEGICTAISSGCSSYDGQRTYQEASSSLDCGENYKCCIPCGPGRFSGGIRQDDPEECDGTDLNGATCQSLGHSSGSLSCYPPSSASFCEYDESDCDTGGPTEYGCTIGTSCSYTTILKATGNYNAHVDKATASDASYPYKVCCRLGTTAFTPQTGQGQSSGIIALTNSGSSGQRHGGAYNKAGFNEYVYLNPSSGSINCGVVDAPGVSGVQSCLNAYYDTCMFTLTDDDDKTGHIADCSHSEYRYKVCCSSS